MHKQISLNNTMRHTVPFNPFHRLFKHHLLTRLHTSNRPCILHNTTLFIASLANGTRRITKRHHHVHLLFPYMPPTTPTPPPSPTSNMSQHVQHQHCPRRRLKRLTDDDTHKVDTVQCQPCASRRPNNITNNGMVEVDAVQLQT